MKFTVDRHLLCESITHLSRSVATKSTIPVLEGILLSAENDSLTMVAYNLEMGMIKKIHSKTIKTGDIVLSAKLFADILRRMDGEIVTISVDERMMCKIESESAVFDIIGMSAADFPELPTVSEGNSISIASNIFKEMVSGVNFAVSSIEGAKPIFTGILFDICENQLTLVAVDGFRIAKRTESVIFDKNMKFVAAGKAINEAVKIIGENDNNIVINIGNRHFTLEAEGYTIISRLIEGEYIDYNNAFPKSFIASVVVNSKKFCDIIERISLIINDQIKSPVRLNFLGDKVNFSSVTTVGRATDECEISLDGNPFEIGFNNRYLLDALKNAPSDILVMSFNGPLAPMVISASEGDSFNYMIMPMRLRAGE